MNPDNTMMMRCNDEASPLNPEEAEMFVDLMEEVNPTNEPEPPQQITSSSSKSSQRTNQKKTSKISTKKAAPRKRTPKKTKQSKPKPPKPPKKPLSAYNIYFQFERKRILDETDHTVPIVNAQVAFQVSMAYRMKPPRKHRKSHGKISFLDLSRTVARRWKLLDPNLKRFFQEQAHTESLQYQPVFEEWKRKLQRLKKNGGDDGDEDCSSANREDDDGPNDIGTPPSFTVSAATSDQDEIMKEDFVVSEDDDCDSVVALLEEDREEDESPPSPTPPQLVLLESPVKTLPPKDITLSMVEMARSSIKNHALARQEKKPSFLEEFPSPTTLRYCPLIARAQTQGYNLFDPITSDSMSILFQQE